MRTFCTGLVLLALGAMVGCSGSSTGTGGHVGGPGATNSTDRSAPLLGPKEGQFELSPPTFSKKIKQGASEPVTIGIKRGKNFDEDVALSFDKVPDHVTLDPAAPTIKKGEKDVKVTVKVGETAGLGEHDIMVTGKPAKGPSVTEKLKITIEKK